MQNTEHTIRFISRPTSVGSIAIIIASFTNIITPWGN